MNKLFSKFAIIIASFAMVIGGASAAIYTKEQVNPVYAEDESLTITGSKYLYVGEETTLTVTPTGFAPTEYTWTSSNLNIVTIEGTGNTATVHAQNLRGGAAITVSAEGTNGTVTSNSFWINVKSFLLWSMFEEEPCNMAPNSSIRAYFNISDANGDVVFETASEDDNIATGKVEFDDNYGHYLDITSGRIDNSSTTITINAKDNGGEPGYHAASFVVTVDVDSFHVIGDRLLTLPSSGEKKMIYIANDNMTKYVYIDAVYSSPRLLATENIEEATLFEIDSDAKIKIAYYRTHDYNEIYVTDRSSPTSTSGSSFKGYFSVANEYTEEQIEERYPLFKTYPGILCTKDSSDQYTRWNYLAINNSVNRVLTTRITSLNAPNNSFEPLFAYEANVPTQRVVAEQDTIEVSEYKTVTTNINTNYVTSLEYEILSGAESIDTVSISSINANNAATFSVSTTNVRGTAIIKVKDVDHPDLYYAVISVTVTRDKSLPGYYLDGLDTQTQLSYRYTKHDDGSFTYSDVSIRFGAVINKYDWHSIDTNSEDITGFGVMITSCESFNNADMFKSNPSHVVSADTDYNLDTDIVDFFMPRSEMETPVSLDTDNYFWNLFFRINEADFDTVYTAAAYIRFDDEIYFLTAARYSVYSLAKDYLENRNYEANEADGSLQNLANQA